MDKDNIKKLIEIFLSDMVEKAKGDNAGWQGESMMARLIDYQGYIPEFTGGDQSNLSMIIAIQHMKKEHYELRKIKKVIYELLGDCRHAQKAQAALARHFYVGINEDTGKAYTDADRLLALGFELPKGEGDLKKVISRYRERVEAGYRVIDEELLKYERYMSAA